VKLVVCRTTESHDPTRFGVSWPPDDLSGAMEGSSRRSPVVAPLLLQFRQASPGIEIWTGSQDAGYAGWSDPTTTDVKGNLLLKDSLSRVDQHPIRALRPGPSVRVAAWRMALAA